MHLFQVWAPAAERVDLVLPTAGRTVAMDRAAHGWWEVAVPEAGHGTDYAFAVDGGDPLPDPRSRHQPHGVHGPSRVVDPEALRPGPEPAWPGREVLGAVFYELHVGTFTEAGTFDAACERLDHLVDIGVEVVELMPVAAFDGRWGWGYDGVDLYAVHEPYGGPQGLARFVDACHERGLAVCLDVVHNHLGPSGNYLNRFGPYFTDKHRSPWGAGINLDDEGCEEVRRWIVDNALAWFRDHRVDALRLDAVHALVDDSTPHLLIQLSQEVAALSKELGRPLSLIAESDLNDPRMVEPVAEGGRGMTAQWSDDFHHALHSLLSHEQHGYYVDFGPLPVLARTFTQVFRHAGDFSTFRGSNWGRPVDPARHRGHRFLAYLQNHDQIGNRATGDRLGATVSPGRLAIGAALVFTSPFTPMLFMGEEWGASTPWCFFTDFDAELGELVRQGRTREFSRHGWSAHDIPDPQHPDTRGRSVLRWAERTEPPHDRLLAWHRDLAALRRAEPELRADALAEVRVSTGPDWLVLHRGRFDVLVNLSLREQQLPCPPRAEVALAWEPPTRRPGGFAVPAESVAIVRS